ncbi:MAG: NRDE family protein [Desulfococcaceae bacterium]
MCLILLGWRAHPAWKLIAAANRDEYYERPSEPIHWWTDCPGLLAGRDLRGGGAWMGVTRAGRFAAVTNFRDPASVRSDAPSRGELVPDFLASGKTAEAWMEELAKRASIYNGFNLLTSDGDELWYFGNRKGEDPERLGPGIYGLSNRFLDTPWPKVERSRAGFSAAISGGTPESEALFRVLADRRRPPDEELPDTGVGLEFERILSPPFIVGPVYGTRSSSVLRMGEDGTGEFWERSFAPENGDVRITETRRIEIVGDSAKNPTWAQGDSQQ